MRCGTFFLTLKFVVALPYGSPVFTIAMPNLGSKYTLAPLETAISHAKPRARSGVKEGRNLDPPPPKPAKNLKNLSLL